MKVFTQNSTTIHPEFVSKMIQALGGNGNAESGFWCTSNEICEGSGELVTYEGNNLAMTVSMDFKKSVQIQTLPQNATPCLGLIFRVSDQLVELVAVEVIGPNKLQLPIGNQFIYTKNESRIWLFEANCTQRILAVYILEQWLRKSLASEIDYLNFDLNLFEKYLQEHQNRLEDYLLRVKNEVLTLIEKVENQNEEDIAEKKKKLTTLTTLFYEYIFQAYSFQFVKGHHNYLQGIIDAEKEMLKNFRVECPSLDNLARISGLNRVKFQQIFKQIYGKSFYEYYQYARFKYVKNLISSGDYNISQTAYEIGFKNLSHFSREFAKRYGFKPNEYRKARTLKSS